MIISCINYNKPYNKIEKLPIECAYTFIYAISDGIKLNTFPTYLANEYAQPMWF